MQRGAKDRRDFQGVDDVKPWTWAEDMRGVADVKLSGDIDGWQFTAVDRTTGKAHFGPVRKNMWDAIQHARALWEGETDRDQN